MTETAAPTTTNETAPARRFETETCSRCGGSGHYSYCQAYGTTCFRCSGRKQTYTKRGAAALAFYESLCKVRADSLKIGDVIRCGGVTNGGTPFDFFATVTGVGVDTGARSVDQVTGELRPMFTITTVCKKRGNLVSGLTVGDGSALVRKAQTADEKAAKLAQAYDYQETLTKAGTPRKTRTKPAA